jgi:hypothetical protein
MFAVILLQLTEGWVWNIILGGYFGYSLVYMINRLVVIFIDDPNYLKEPKR